MPTLLLCSKYIYLSAVHLSISRYFSVLLYMYMYVAVKPIMSDATMSVGTFSPSLEMLWLHPPPFTNISKSNYAFLHTYESTYTCTLYLHVCVLVQLCYSAKCPSLSPCIWSVTMDITSFSDGNLPESSLDHIRSSAERENFAHEYIFCYNTCIFICNTLQQTSHPAICACKTAVEGPHPLIVH